jgi:prefoldin subunit 5
MNKQQQKAKQIVQKATGTFSKAIEEVNKAIALLESAAEQDEQTLKQITAQIEGLYKQLDTVQAEKLDKKAEVIQHKELIAKLEKFTV